MYLPAVAASFETCWVCAGRELELPGRLDPRKDLGYWSVCVCMCARVCLRLCGRVRGFFLPSVFASVCLSVCLSVSDAFPQPVPHGYAVGSRMREASSDIAWRGGGGIVRECRVVARLWTLTHTHTHTHHTYIHSTHTHTHTHHTHKHTYMYRIVTQDCGRYRNQPRLRAGEGLLYHTIALHISHQGDEAGTNSRL